MRRRGRRRHIDPSNRDTFGNTGMNHLKQKTAVLARNWIASTLRFEWNKDELFGALIDPEVKDILTKGAALAENPRHTWYSQPNYKVVGMDRISLAINWENNCMLAPKTLHINSDKFKPFQVQLEKMRDVYDRFAKVVMVADYFNRYATPAAIRALWPSALSLLPPTMLDKFQTTDYQDPPQYLNQHLELIRETAPLIASALMCPQSEEQAATFEALVKPQCESGMKTFEWDTIRHPLV